MTYWRALAQTNVLTVRLDAPEKALLEKATAETWFKKDHIVSTLLGVLVALVVVWVEHRIRVSQEQKAEAAFVRRVLRAIRAELDALKEVYDRSVGRQLATLADGERFNVSLGVSLGYFSVFESNAVHLGKLPSEVATRIVRLYVHPKSLIDNFRVNNDYLDQYAALSRQYEQVRVEQAQLPPGAHRPPSLPSLGLERGWIEGLMVAKAAELRDLDREVRAQYTELVALIQQAGLETQT
jgi:hypothetical protein